MKPVINPVLQAKFLQHLNNKKKGDEGFTLIELLVVVIIIGVLAAIALPSLLGQVNKAKQSEAKQYVGTLNRAQQAFYLEYQNFATSVIGLQVGIKQSTSNYTYLVNAPSPGAWAQQVGQPQATAKSLKGYFGLVGTAVGDTATSEALTLGIACESLAPTTTVATATSWSTDCTTTGAGTNYTSLSK